jgi:aspartate aminotransferase-like enzyme
MATPTSYRLRLPGPTDVPERVRVAAAQPVVNHRGPEFRAVLARTEDLLRPLLGTSQRVLFFATSGTGMMEAALANVCAPGDRILVIVHGQFGERFVAIGRALGLEVDSLEATWGDVVPMADVEAKLKSGPYKAMVAVQNESSTGVVADISTLGTLAQRHSCLLVVDAVSALGGIAMRQDEWGVDIVVSASQKALMCPPGVGIASLSAKAQAACRKDGPQVPFYFGFRRALESADKGETAFTAPVNALFGLNEALEMIAQEGLTRVLERHRRLSDALRAGGEALGLSIYGRQDARSPTVVVFGMPEGLEGGPVVKRLYEDYGTVIAGARNRLSGKVIRFGVMGHVTEGTIVTDVLHLAGVLRTLGMSVDQEKALSAVARSLEERR